MSKIKEAVKYLQDHPKTKAKQEETDLLIKILTEIDKNFSKDKSCDYSGLEIADSVDEIKYKNEPYMVGGHAYSCILKYKDSRILRLYENIYDIDKNAYIKISWKPNGLGLNEDKLFDLVKETSINTENIKTVIKNIFAHNNVENLSIDGYNGYVTAIFDYKNNSELINIINSIVNTIIFFMNISDLFYSH